MFQKQIWGKFLDSIKKDPEHRNSKILKEFKWKYFENYTLHSARLSWKMVTQVPAMTLRCDGIGEPYQGDALQEVAYGSEDPRQAGNVVKLYVTPAVFHGEHLMCKGKVVCGPKLC